MQIVRLDVDQIVGTNEAVSPQVGSKNDKSVHRMDQRVGAVLRQFPSFFSQRPTLMLKMKRGGRGSSDGERCGQLYRFSRVLGQDVK